MVERIWGLQNDIGKARPGDVSTRTIRKIVENYNILVKVILEKCFSLFLLLLYKDNLKGVVYKNDIIV